MMKILGFLLTSLSVSTLSAATLTVDLNGGADYTKIQSAINAALDGDTVLVRPGEYIVTRPISFKGKGITVRSQAGAAATTIRMANEPADATRASVVIFESGEGSRSLLEGFTITGGQGTNYGEPWRIGGGGIFFSGSSPTLADCTISGNRANRSGGGFYCLDSSPNLTGCLISENCSYFGGAMLCSNSSPSLTNCTIAGNSAEEGVIMYCDQNSAPSLTSCIAWGNVGDSFLLAQDSLPIVSFSCIESRSVITGESNINSDPLFCGFRGPRDVYIDPGSPEPGDGSPESPFRELARGLEYRLTLRPDSPCIGRGKGGSNMGSEAVTCDADRSSDRILHLAQGRYRMDGLILVHGVSLLGKGAKETVLEGTVWGLRTGARVSGVRVTGGRLGGIVIQGAESPTVEDCEISENTGEYTKSSGLFCGKKSSAIILNCTISRNSLDPGYWMSGAVYCHEASSPTFSYCTISGNSGQDVGAVVCWQGASPTLTNCTISGNSGTGLCLYLRCNPILARCTISGNSSRIGDGYTNGGGLSCIDSSPILTECTITGNRAVWGGGAYIRGVDAAPILTNCTIVGNSAKQGGGAHISLNSPIPIFRNCTIAANSSGLGGGVYCDDGAPNLIDSIIWGNREGSIVRSPELPGSPVASHCCIEGVPIWPGEGNIDADPLFVDPGYLDNKGTPDDPYDDTWLPGDYHLRSGSPAIDAGTSEKAPCVDLEGHGRPCGAGVDIGAYESGDCVAQDCGGPGPVESPVTFQLGEITAAPGQADVLLPLSILVEPGSGPVALWQCSVRFDPASLVRAIAFEPARKAYRFIPFRSTRYLELGMVGAAAVCSLNSETEDQVITSSNQGFVAFGRICLSEDAAPGVYPVEFVLDATLVDGVGASTQWTDGKSTPKKPRTIDGVLTIAGEPRVGQECQAILPCPEPQPPPAVLSAKYIIPGGRAKPGEAVAVPLSIESNHELAGFSFSLDFDEEILEATDIERVYRNPDGSDWDFRLLGFDNSNATPGNGGIDEGCVCGAVIFTWNCLVPLPPRDTENLMAILRFRVKPEARPGITELRFLDGGRVGTSMPIENVATISATSVDPEYQVATIAIGTALSIVSDFTLFLRGDSNADSTTDISDAIGILSFLFTGGKAPPCQKAADVTDDGTVDISDGVALLSHLFLGGKAPPEPFAECGVDPTADELTCDEYGPCE